MSQRRCLDDQQGRPFCGARAEGAFLVEQPVDVTCDACLTLCHRDVVTLRFHRTLIGAPPEGFPLLKLPAVTVDLPLTEEVRLTGDVEIEGDDLFRYLSDGGELFFDGWRCLVRKHLKVPAGVIFDDRGFTQAIRAVH